MSGGFEWLGLFKRWKEGFGPRLVIRLDELALKQRKSHPM